MLKAARKGGSVSPEAKRLLDASPTVVIATGTDVAATSVDEFGKTWLETVEGDRLGPFDRVWLATGGAPGVAGSPLFGAMLRARPVDVVGGFPALHPSLRWDVDTPVYVMGAAAALALGPDALNLAGARMSSCRVASVIRTTLRTRCLDGETMSPEAAAAVERRKARKLEELAVKYLPSKGTVSVRGRPSDAGAGVRRRQVQREKRGGK